MDFREKIVNDLDRSGIETLSHNIVDDLFIKKYIELNKPLKQEIEDLPKRLDFSDFENMDRESMEAYAGNFFVDVSDGERAEGEVRVYFMEADDSFIPRGTRFATRDGVVFQAIEDFEISASEMENYVDGIYYYQPVTVRAADTGEEYNVDPESITICTNPIIMSRAARIENPFAIEGGRNPETPRELYNRVQNSISDRTLANTPGINSLLRENFPASISDIFTARTGSVFMERDITMIGNRAHRIGNKHDIWIDSNDLEERTAVLSKDSGRHVNFGFSISALGPSINEHGFEYNAFDIDGEPIEDIIVQVNKVEAIDASGEILEEIPDVRFLQEEGLENSVRQQSMLDFDGTEYNDTVANIKVTYIASRALTEMQRFINDESTRMPVGDPLIRQFELIPLYGTLYYRGAEDALDLQEKFYEFINSYDYNALRAEKEEDDGYPFRRIIEVSDFIQALKTHDVDKVKLPISFEIHFPYDVASQTFYAIAGEAVPLDHKNIVADSVTVTNFNQTVAYNEGEDYEVDYEQGNITMLEDGDMTSNATYVAIYEFDPEQVLEDELKILPYQTLSPEVVMVEEG